MNADEISPETRLLLIELFDGVAEGVRKNIIQFSEGNARALAQWADGILHPEKRKIEDESKWKNITEACDLLHITQPTFRKYIRQGKLAEGIKRKGYHELVWEKTEIERFKAWYFSKSRKGLKG
jgi:hypothetical protein